jgi:hypothetical protein
MVAPYHAHAIFEDAVHRAFPISPIPKEEWGERTVFAMQANQLLANKTWPEVIGCRLDDWELDPSLSVWMVAMPLEIFHYYLPSHLIFASISLALGSVAYYPLRVMEAFILPPDSDQASWEAIDEKGFFESSLEENAKVRMDLYKRMTEEQRDCIATYLSLYWEHRKSELAEPGFEELYMRNRDFWQNSSYQF